MGYYIYGRDSVIIFDMEECGWLYCISEKVYVVIGRIARGEVWDLFMRLEWFWGSVVGGFWGTFGVWFYCVCWDEVDNALRKGRGLPKNVNRGYVYKYKNS